jgi:hypothetical protein
MKSEILTKFITKKVHDVIDFIYAIGFFGELLCLLLSCFILLGHPMYLILYIIFFGLESFINKVFKGYIKQLRPSNPVKFLDNESFSKTKVVFGMPSGHTQSTFFSLTFIYLVLHKINIWVILLFVVNMITFYQRYVFKNHTLQQLTMGAIIGVIFGYITYYLVTKIVRYI